MPPAYGLRLGGYLETPLKRPRMVFEVDMIQVVMAAVLLDIPSASTLCGVASKTTSIRITSTVLSRKIEYCFSWQVLVASGGDAGTLHWSCKLLASLPGAAAAEGRGGRSVGAPADSPRGARGSVRRAGTAETSLHMYIHTCDTLYYLVLLVFHLLERARFLEKSVLVVTWHKL